MFYPWRIAFLLTFIPCKNNTLSGYWQSKLTLLRVINKCIDDVVPTVTVHTYLNQKPWITGSICTELKGRAAASKGPRLTRKLIRNPAMPSEEPSNRESINTGQRLKLTTPLQRQGLHTMTDYKGKHSRELPSVGPAKPKPPEGRA